MKKTNSKPSPRLTGRCCFRDTVVSKTTFLLLIFMLSTGLAQSQEDGLSPETALPISCGLTDGDSTGFPPANTTEHLTDSACNPLFTSNLDAPAVWYTYTGTGEFNITLTTCGYDTSLVVYSGTPGSLSCVTGSGDTTTTFCTTNSFESQVTFSEELGVTYYIKLWGYDSGEYGPYQIEMLCEEPPVNDDCSGAIAVSCGDVVTGNTSSATSDSSLGTCVTSLGTAPGVWYVVEGTGTPLRILASTAESEYDTKLGVFSGSCGDLVCVTGNDDGGPGTTSEVIFDAAAGVNYYIYVTGFSSNAGNYTLSLECLLVANIEQDCITAYNGYCPKITADASYGQPPYTYAWSDGSDTFYTEACVTENTVLTVTVTDANGDTASDEITVIYSPEDVSCGNDKVVVCHIKGNGETSELCLSPDAVQSHLDHGDTVGYCEGSYYTCESLPSCPSITAPSNNAQDLTLPVTIEWTAALGLVDGYHVSVGTSMGGTEIVDNAEGGFDLEYTLNNLDFSTTYYATVTAYNANGDSESCTAISFTTQRSPCGLAETLTCDYSTSGTTVGASIDSQLSGTCGGVSLTTSPGVWYTFVGTGDVVKVDTEDSSLDTKLGVFIGSCGDLTCIDGDDDGGISSGSSLVTFTSIPGQNYYFYVTGYLSNEGSYNINVSCATPLPNDDCDGAQAVRVNPLGTECEITFTADHTNATDSGAEFSCDYGGVNIDSWYTFAGPASGIVELSTINLTQTGTPGWAIYDDCSGALLFCNDNTSLTQTVPVTPDTVYTLAVWYDDTSTTTHGTFNICLNEGPPPVENDECSGAINVPVSPDMNCVSTVAGSTENSTESLPGCSGTANDDVWYSFTATSANHSIITTNTGGSSDIVTQVFDACGGTSIKCQDTPNSPVNLTGLTIGNTYYFRIYSYSSSSSTRSSFNVCVGTTPVPDNDDCSSAEEIFASTDDSCSNAVSGTTAFASNSADYSCSSYYNEVWYEFTPTSSGDYVIERTVTSGTTYAYVSIWSGDCGSLTRINSSCYSTSLVESLTANTTYYISVGNYYTYTPAEFDLCVYPAPVAPDNDLPTGAFSLTANEDDCLVETYTNQWATDSGVSSPGCASYSGSDVWFVVSVLAGNEYTFETSADVMTDSGMAIYSGAPESLSLIDCNDDIGYPNYMSRITYIPTVDEDIYVRVWEYSNDNNGTFGICVSYSPPPPAPGCNDMTISVGGGSYTYETSWDIEGSGGIVASGSGGESVSVNLPDGNYTIYMYDSWGDGWNGNTYTVVDGNGSTIATGGLDCDPCDFGSDSFTVACGSITNRVANTNQSSTIDWSMAPNPTRGNVTLDLSNYLLNTVTIDVVDYTGKVISTATLNEVQSAKYTLELRSSLPAGMYFVRVASAAQVSTKKLMIMR